MRWDKKDIPHKGWIEIGMEDLGAEAEFGRVGRQLLLTKRGCLWIGNDHVNAYGKLAIYL